MKVEPLLLCIESSQMGWFNSLSGCFLQASFKRIFRHIPVEEEPNLRFPPGPVLDGWMDQPKALVGIEINDQEGITVPRHRSGKGKH